MRIECPDCGLYRWEHYCLCMKPSKTSMVIDGLILLFLLAVVL